MTFPLWTHQAVQAHSTSGKSPASPSYFHIAFKAPLVIELQVVAAVLPHHEDIQVCSRPLLASPKAVSSMHLGMETSQAQTGLTSP